MKYILIFLFICSCNFSFSQEYYYTATDDDSITYVAASGKLLVLKRDAESNLNLVISETIEDLNYHSAAVSQDKLLLTSVDTAYIFDISDRLNPVYLAKKYFGNIARGEKFGEYFIIVKRETSGHSVIGIVSDTIKVFTTLERPCNCWETTENMCANLTFSYPYAFFRFSFDLLETWEFDAQAGLFYLLNLADYTPNDWELRQISSSNNYVFLLLCRDLGGGYYDKKICKMIIEIDTLIQQSIITVSGFPPTVGGDWDISEGYHRIVSMIFRFNTQSYDENYSYDTNIDLLTNPLPIITDNYVYQCGNEFYYSYRITNDSLFFKKDILPSNITDTEIIPSDFSLSQNYPNPFNPTTKIQYSVGNSQFVTLKVYDVLGNEVATLVNKEQPAGNYSVEFNGSKLSSGIYFYQLKTGDYTETKKIILLK